MATPVPPRNNRVLQAADSLKRQIHSGALIGALPGESELAKRIGVSRGTLREAMQVLTDEKWITPPKRGHRRQILKPPILLPDAAMSPAPSNDLQGKTIVMLSPSPLEQIPTNDRLDYARINSFAARAGITLRHRHLDLSHLKLPSHRLKQFILQNPADLYYLHLSTHETQQWFSKNNIPCIVLGSTWQDVNLPQVDTDQRAIGLHAAATLSRLGHQQAWIFYPTPEKRVLQLFTEGFSQGAPKIKLTLARQDDTPEGIQKALLALSSSKENRATALILPKIPHVMTAATVLPSAGLHIPRDLSLLCLVYDDALRYLYPSIAAYHIPADSFARAAFDLSVKKLSHPDTRLDGTCLITPELITGSSLAKAPLTNTA